MKIVIMDLDGVICDNSHRAHLVPPVDQQHRNEAWRPFVEECVNDKPIPSGAAFLNIVRLSGEVPVVIITSRQQAYSEITYNWLRSHNLYCTEVIFRPDDNHLSPKEYKRTVVRDLKDKSLEILFAIDDDPAIIAMYNEEVIATFMPSTRCSSIR